MRIFDQKIKTRFEFHPSQETSDLSDSEKACLQQLGLDPGLRDNAGGSDPMMFNKYEKSDEKKMGELRHYVEMWRRFLTSTFTLLLTCALVYPFLAEHSLHEYWESIGKNLVLLSMVLLLVWGWCATVFYNAWLALRTAEKGQE